MTSFVFPLRASFPGVVSPSPARLAGAALVAWLAACGGSATAAGAVSEGASPAAQAARAASDVAAQVTTPTQPASRQSARIFVTGHSLVDNPLPDNLVQIANSLGGKSEYNQQNVIGSPLRVRTRGNDANGTGWAGYKTGKNRDGQNMDVLAEIAKPKTVGGPYDVLLLTERHDLYSALVWEDTVRYARHYHDRVVAANPAATTYFYQSWLGIQDNAALGEWIAYERAAAPVWSCMASRINKSLVAEGRGDRVVPLRAGSALVELVERATQGSVPGITAGSAGETVKRLVADGVHLTPLGVYYMSLVSYGSIYGRSPQGAWRPSGVSAEQAASLQSLAWEFVGKHQNEPQQTPEQCAALMRDSFCKAYGTYTRQSQTEASCRSQFSSANHAFAFNPQADKAHWLPSP
jgi:hypothetical protein